MQKRISRNAPCPCGSERKYKHCCLAKGIEWGYDEEGFPVRTIPITDQTAEALQAHVQRLERDKGGPLAPDDLLFPELAEASEEAVREQLVAAMRDADLDPALVYAFQQTGMLLSEETLAQVPEGDRQAWLQAIREFRAMAN